MISWGIDLGVRSVYAAGISDNGALSHYVTELKVKGKVANQSPEARAQELVSLAGEVGLFVFPGDICHVEEPPLAGGRNVRTFLKLAQTSAAVAIGALRGGAEAIVFVPVDTWKKETVGRGGADKELVARWLERTYPDYYALCNADQNLIDATCIAIRAARARGLDQPRSELAAS